LSCASSAAHPTYFKLLILHFTYFTSTVPLKVEQSQLVTGFIQIIQQIIAAK